MKRSLKGPLGAAALALTMLALPTHASTDLVCTSVNTEIRGFVNRFTLAHDATWLVGSDGNPPYILACLPSQHVVVCSGKDILIAANRERNTLTVVTHHGDKPVKLLYNCRSE